PQLRSAVLGASRHQRCPHLRRSVRLRQQSRGPPHRDGDEGRKRGGPMSGPKGIVPERLILELLRTGIEVIVADLASAQQGESILDNIRANLDAAERARHREWFATNPPSTLMGYPRIDGPFPVIALTLAGDTVDRDYLGVG